MLSFLKAWLRRKRTASSPPPRAVVLYTRQGCQLCDTAWMQLQTAQARWGFTVATVDVDSDPELVIKYGDCVPVVTIDGVVRFRGRVNDVLLERMVRGPG